jgi:hypothetical protein
MVTLYTVGHSNHAALAQHGIAYVFLGKELGARSERGASGKNHVAAHQEIAAPQGACGTTSTAGSRNNLTAEGCAES